MAARIEPLITVDDLEAMPEDGNRYEVIEGELFVSRAHGLSHQIISGNLLYEFKKYLDQNPIGVIASSIGLIFDRHSGVIPDLVFFTNERGLHIIKKDRLIASPDLAIEILSPGTHNIARDRIIKRQLYAKHLMKEYWIVDAENRSVEIYRLVPKGLLLAETLTENSQLSSPLLPNFSCSLTAIFK